MSQSLDGDGINFAFFNLLWSKNIHQDQGESQAPLLRIPDTVVFLFGLPHHWYFTSKNGGPNRDETTILRKRRNNLTLENIEEVFLDKASSRGPVGEDDVVAYFIERGHVASGNGDSCCNIEYFNPRSLHHFLLKEGKANKSGILQRFINPHGSRHNSQIRAIWTPKLCLQERRRTKQELHDNRFAIYERAITFDGPEIHSVSVPLRGSVLAGRIGNICTEISQHINEVAKEDAESKRYADDDIASIGVTRMVVNFKVDGAGRIWILWSDSIRLENTSLLSEVGPSSSMQRSISKPLIIDTLVEVPASTKLSQVPNHSISTKLENKMRVASCPSCCRDDFDHHFQPVPYKTILQHFDTTLEMLESCEDSHPAKTWPPEKHYIQAAGGIGFEMLSSQLANDREVKDTKRVQEDSLKIPPIIRHIHPKLQAKAFQMYRNDTSFLSKTCKVCEDCYLAYAQLTSSNFIISRPIEISDAFEGKSNTNSSIPDAPTNPNPNIKRVSKHYQRASLLEELVEDAPDIPNAIVDGHGKVEATLYNIISGKGGNLES